MRFETLGRTYDEPFRQLLCEHYPYIKGDFNPFLVRGKPPGTLTHSLGSKGRGARISGAFPYEIGRQDWDGQLYVTP